MRDFESVLEFGEGGVDELVELYDIYVMVMFNGGVVESFDLWKFNDEDVVLEL